MRTGCDRWIRRVLLVASRTAVGAASDKSDALCCTCGIGAFETEQQDVPDEATTRVPLSSIFIWSHWDCVFGFAHSAGFEESSAQAESGTCPSPKRLNANAKMSGRRTDIQSNTRAFHTEFPLSYGVAL
jgi:hypothetical protein